jgi:four helix bundle protein
MADYRKLHVWRKAYALALNTHRVAGRIRGQPALRGQLVRATMSVGASIVEGRQHKSDKEFARFLRIALASAAEAEYHLLIGVGIKAINETDFDSLNGELTDIRKMLTGLLKKLESSVT